MGDIIDFHLMRDSRRYLHNMLSRKGLAYFLKDDRRRPFELEPKKVELVLKAAAASRGRELKRMSPNVVTHTRTQVRKELIRRVVAEMLSVGL